MERGLKRTGLRLFMAALLFLLLACSGTVSVHAASGGFTGFAGDYYYKKGKKQKKKAVKYQGHWYVLDSKGRMVRGKTYKLKGATYRLRPDGTAYTGAWMFGKRIYIYGSDGKLNRSKTDLMKRYSKESVSEKSKPFSKVKKYLGKIRYAWKTGGCGGSGYYQNYYYEHGFLVTTYVDKKKSYFSYAEKTPWDPTLIDE